MKIEARLILIETKQKYFERLLYGIYVLLAANLGINVV